MPYVSLNHRLLIAFWTAYWNARWSVQRAFIWTLTALKLNDHAARLAHQYGLRLPRRENRHCVRCEALHGPCVQVRSLEPGASVVKLWLLHRERQLLTPEWNGWLIKPDAIVDPEGNKTNRNLLRGYQLMMQFAHHLARRTGDQREIERFYELLKAA